MKTSIRELRRRLHRAFRFIESGKVERLAAEIRRCPELATTEMNHDSLILHAYNYNQSCIEFLLRNGPVCCIGGMLNLACCYGELELVELYLKYGADVNYVNGDGETPFTWACAHDRLEVAKYLHDAGANINHLLGGTTPMDNECHSQRIIDFLTEIGAKREAEIK
ncbi:MAG: ankyrin repeat domain-containing protein [Planctomycetota bacterium]|jgi:ankyrin repeat protein